jgi:DNA repair photolyase
VKRREGRPARGAPDNPSNRFDKRAFVPDPEAADPEELLPATQLIRDASRSIITTNDSPDVGFEASVNPYRGCEHGCPYCFARPTHEYLGYSAGLDFESKIVVKENAPELLRDEFLKPSWTPKVLALSGVTDPYQPVERRLGLTRRCLEVLAAFRNPVVVVTKNFLVTRDADLLSELARARAAKVMISITTLDADLARAMEPRASVPARRLAAIGALATAGIPVGVLVAPVIPALTDHEIPAIVDAAARAGASDAGMVMLRLPFGVKEIFEAWLRRQFPDRADRVMRRIREVRGGRLNDPRFGSRMTGEGIYAGQARQLFDLARRKAGWGGPPAELSTASYRRPDDQLRLF